MIAGSSGAAITIYCAILATATWTDLRTRRIPNRLTIPALCVALIAAAWAGGLASAMAGALLGAGLFILPMFLYGTAAAGGGDVKLAAFIGAALGFTGTINALFLAGLIAAAVVLVGLATRRIARRQRIPFGPFLALGGILALLLA